MLKQRPFVPVQTVSTLVDVHAHVTGSVHESTLVLVGPKPLQRLGPKTS